MKTKWQSLEPNYPTYANAHTDAKSECPTSSRLEKAQSTKPDQIHPYAGTESCECFSILKPQTAT